MHVRDHCHITGKFRGSAHQECTLKLRIKPEDIKIPVIFHNLRGYDSHLIMQQIGEITNAGIDLTGYHPPGTLGLLHRNVCPAPGLLHNRQCLGAGL